jgi:hypothetical protein
MLKLPSQILAENNVPSLRAYAIQVYKRITSAKDTKLNSGPSLNITAFNNATDAATIFEKTQERFDAAYTVSTSDCVDQSVHVLPPLFIRSDNDWILSISDSFFLVCFASGAIIPVTTNANDDSTLASIIDFYQLVSPTFFNQKTAVEIIGKIKK